MKILILNFTNEIYKTTTSDAQQDEMIYRHCFCGCDWHGCDCEYNCFNDDDCTSDSY